MLLNHKKIALFATSKSGKGKGLKLLSQIELYLNNKKINYYSFIDNWAENLESFTEVWIIGGDGTLNYFINKYKNLTIPLAIFKGGTGNDIAFALYGDCNLEQQLQRILNASSTKIDVGYCNQKLFLNGVGIGFDGEILQKMNSIRFVGGHLGYLIVVIKKIFSFKEHYFEITTKDFKFKSKFLVVSIFNGLRTGGGFYIAPNANLQDGLLEVILCNPLSIFKRLINLPIIEKGKHLKLPFIHYKQTTSITIKASKVLPAQLDGELFYANEFNIEVLSNYFNVLK